MSAPTSSGLDKRQYISVIPDIKMHDLILLSKAFADPTRIRILNVLRKTESCVCELCDALEISQSTLSTHLQVIRQAGIVDTRKEGTWVYYRIDERVMPLLETFFAYDQDAISADKRMKRDRERIEKRFALRDAGRCHLGFDQLDEERR